jgi:hemerythrin
MGTYLVLELKDKTPQGIAQANALWAFENKDGFEDTVHFRSEQDILEGIEYIKLDPKQEHLRVYDTVEKVESALPFQRGVFKVKLTMGDYLCSEMARRYLRFIEEHHELLVNLPDEEIMTILEKKAEVEEVAEECIVDCPYCGWR